MARTSVIIPLYNSEKYLEATVASVMNQSTPDWELILIDDCSTDGTYRLAQRLAKSDSRIRVLRHDKNLGRPAYGRNTGIAAATGTFITFLDHDDAFEPTKLAEQGDAMEGLDFLVSNCYLLNARTGKVDGQAWKEVRGEVQKNFARRLLEGNFVPPNSTFIRASVFKKVGVFDPEIQGVDDYDMWYRIARECPSGVVNKPLATWRYSNKNSLSANEVLMLENEVAFYKKVHSYGEDWEKTLATQGERRCLQRLGHRALARGDIAQARALYKEAGAERLLLLTTRAPFIARTMYWMKRCLDRLRQQDFQPLVIDFNPLP